MEGLDRFSADNVVDWLLSHGVRILIILALMWLASLLLRRVLRVALRRALVKVADARRRPGAEQRAETLVGALHSTGWAMILVVGFITVLTELGLNIGPVLAGAGIGGLALALGAQSLVRDALSGLFILAEGQYAQGDWVTLAGISGQVEEVNLRRTVLRDERGTFHFIPHGQIPTASRLTSPPEP